jgi:hypothetical protein
MPTDHDLDDRDPAGVRECPHPLVTSRPPPILGEVGAADGSRLGERHLTGVREGAPPPAPPRANYARRGENSIA